MWEVIKLNGPEAVVGRGSWAVMWDKQTGRLPSSRSPNRRLQSFLGTTSLQENVASPCNVVVGLSASVLPALEREKDGGGAMGSASCMAQALSCQRD